MQEKKAYFERVYESYVRSIFRFIYLRVNSGSMAEDLTSETFLKFWKIVEQGKTIENERALLYIIARGLVYDYYRRKNTKQEVSLTDMQETASSSLDELIESIDRKWELERVLGILGRLKKEYQEILVLRFIEDLEYAEISRVMNKNETNVRVLVHRAVRALKEKL